VSLPMDERSFNSMVQFTEANPYFPLALNQDLRPTFQPTDISSRSRPGSSLFISGIPYALNTFTLSRLFMRFSGGMIDICRCQQVTLKISLLSFRFKTGHTKAISEVNSIPHDRLQSLR
jgi:hypothetical protein